MTPGDQPTAARRRSSWRRAMLAALLLATSAVAAGAGWLSFLRPDELGRISIDRHALPRTDDLRRIWVDRESKGGRCSDARTAEEAASQSTPWCSLARAVESAPAGSRVRVRGGDYGRVEIIRRDRARAVVLEAHPDERVELSQGLRIEDSRGFRLQGFRISSPGFTSSIFRSSRIAVVGNDFSPRGLLMRAVEESIVAGNRFHDIVREPGKPAPDGYALYVLGHSLGKADERVRLLTIRNNRFSNIPNDAIQLGGGPSRIIDVVIEGNEFSGIRRQVADDHPDPIQILGGDGVTIRSNFFHDSEVALLIKDDVTRRLVVENNLMIGASGGGIQAQLWDTPGARVIGNTIWGSRLGGLRLADEAECCGTPSGIVVKRNIIDKYTDGNAAWIADQDDNVIVSGPRHGAHDVAVSPTFTRDWRPAGPTPALWAGARVGLADERRTAGE